MNAHRETQGALYDHASGLLDPARRREVEAHLNVCAECRADLETIREIVREFPPPLTTPAEELGDGYWRAFADRVDGAIRSSSERPRGIWGEMTDQVVAILSRTWKPVWATAGAIAVMLIVFVTTVDRQPAPPPTPQIAPASAAATSAPDSSTLRLARYLKRSGALLVGIANRDQRGEEVDIGLEREVSRALVRESRELRNEPLDRQSAALLGDLERIMIEIGSREELTDRDHFDLIRSGINDGNLLFKIRMTEELMTRQVQLQTASYGHVR
jgi:hypothetical protein